MATYVGMVIREWCCVITLYVHFVDQCHPYILLISICQNNNNYLVLLVCVSKHTPTVIFIH